jgi:ketosteroid isomerase-like protein
VNETAQHVPPTNVRGPQVTISRCLTGALTLTVLEPFLVVGRLRRSEAVHRPGALPSDLTSEMAGRRMNGPRAARKSEEEPLAHPNEDLVRRGYEAFATGDMATLNELFADDIVWHAPGRNELAGTYRGKDEVFANLQKNMELTGGTFKLDIHAILADDEHAVTLLRASGEREGKALNDNTVQVFHIKDGKVTESWLHPSDAYASDEFWS